MKIIIGGSTSMVGTELIRQALSHPDVTTLVALGRREISPPPNLGPKADLSKLKSVALGDFEKYPENVKKELSGADAVIWTIGIGPSKLNTMSWEEACKISRDYAIAGIETITALPREGRSKPLRFIYMSGSNAERDQTKKPWILGDFCLMRGDAESRILAYAQQSNGAVEASIAKPGIIVDPQVGGVMTKVRHTFIQAIAGIGTVALPVISTALLDQALHGFEKDTLGNEDLNRLGQGAVAA